MLKIVLTMRELNFPELMEVYREGNQENGEEMWPDEEPERQREMAETAFETYLREEFFPTKGAVYALWQASGRTVSALRLEPYRDGWLVEGLETAPDCRCRGYAGALLAEAMAYLSAQGARCAYSHVSRRNRPSLAVHRRCGFAEVLDYAVYIDGTVNSRAVTLRRQLAP